MKTYVFCRWEMLLLMITMTTWGFSSLCGQLVWFLIKHTGDWTSSVIFSHLYTLQLHVIRFWMLLTKNLDILTLIASSHPPALVMWARQIGCWKESTWVILNYQSMRVDVNIFLLCIHIFLNIFCIYRGIWTGKSGQWFLTSFKWVKPCHPLLPQLICQKSIKWSIFTIVSWFQITNYCFRSSLEMGLCLAFWIW